jgi:hypothetical protein
LNQIESSKLKKEYGNDSREIDSYVNEHFVNQEENNFGQEMFVGATYQAKFTSQNCQDLFISMGFRGNFLSWKELDREAYNAEMFNNIGPSFSPTDFGACCLFVPNLDFQASAQNLSTEKRYHGLLADAQSGRMNGLQLLLDAEQFNYAHIPLTDGIGFKLALHHHLDKPMIQFSSQLINAGTETQINIKPTISYTTNNAISMLKPDERYCYAKGEANLTYLPYSSVFHYSLNNCIVDELIAFILWECRCIPGFASLWIVHTYKSSDVDDCIGEKLYCANAKINSLDAKDITLLRTGQNPEKIGNISKPADIKCRASCRDQENNNQMSTLLYPQKRNFFYRKNFCYVASHILQITCNDEDRRHFLGLEYPDLCRALQYFETYFDNTSTCNHWPENFLDKHDNSPNQTLMREILKYGRENLALVRIMIQSPYATKIKRDLAMTITSYIANAGGLLGLCLGFSFISGIEVLFWICCSCQEVWRNVRKYHS